jgi:hypothetical protein
MNVPEILLEVLIAGDGLPFLEGDGNREKKKECGIVSRIELDKNTKASIMSILRGEP